jgi:uncharacterized protein (DUF305 family)
MSVKHLALTGAALLSLMVLPAQATEAVPTHTMAAPAPQKTGNPDVDFALEMIPHHEAAIVMSEAYLKEAKDPTIKRLAAQILNAQKGEIKTMETWLKKNGPKKAQ